MSGQRQKHPSMLWLVPIAVVGTDQLCKYLAEHHLQNKTVKVGKTPVVLRCSYNRGAAMNLMQERPDLVRDISAIMSGAVTAMFAGAMLDRDTEAMSGAATAMFAGAMLDRSTEEMSDASTAMFADTILGRKAETDGSHRKSAKESRLQSRLQSRLESRPQSRSENRLKGKELDFRAAGLSLLCGGAWSNTLDRLRGVPVTDYISIDAGPEQARDIVYNLADFAIAAGTLITIVQNALSEQN